MDRFAGCPCGEGGGDHQIGRVAVGGERRVEGAEAEQERSAAQRAGPGADEPHLGFGEREAEGLPVRCARLRVARQSVRPGGVGEHTGPVAGRRHGLGRRGGERWRGQTGRTSDGAGAVGGGDVREQDVQGSAVAGDVVHQQREETTLRALSEQAHAQGAVVGEVECVPAHRLPLVDVGGARVVHCPLRLGRSRSPGRHLAAAVEAAGEDGMAGCGITHRFPEGPLVERATELPDPVDIEGLRLGTTGEPDTELGGREGLPEPSTES